MASAPGVGDWSPSVDRALLWASGCAAVRGGDGTVTSDELFLGLLLAHPDAQGEVWQFLDHFGLTARDLLPDDYPVVDTAVLSRAAASARGPDPTDWDTEVSGILTDASARAGGRAQVLHVMTELLGRAPWPGRVQTGLNRFGISASDLVRELESVVPSLASADADGDLPGEPEQGGGQTIDLGSPVPAGAQIGQWLAQRFPLRPATMASFSNDLPDPGADFVGVSEEADAFAYLIASRTLVPPLAIGLFGDWGSGKSFLMAKIRARVRQLTALAASGGDSSAGQIWPKVVPIEFNAWQYVETDLWAALLSRIFDELPPEARLKLTELSRRQQEHRAQQDRNVAEQMRAESAVAHLVVAEETDVRAAEAAAQRLERVRQQVSVITDAAVRGALDVHARSAASAAVVGGLGAVLGLDVADDLREVHRLQVAARAPAWRQRQFWSARRVVAVSLALLVVPLVVLGLDRAGFEPLVAISAALGTCAALLIPLVRAAATFLQGQQQAADEAARRVEEQLSGLVKEAEAQDRARRDQVRKTQKKIREERQNAANAAAKGVDLGAMAARLDAGTVYADFLSGRYSSDDYRKRLGIVTTVSEDLAKLSSLIAEYNDSPQARHPDGPPNRIVLYIDDLDRCPPSRVVEVLEAVHLLLAFPLFVVVVAVDTRWLSAALSRALPILQNIPRPGAPGPTATDYIEKIFQIPFWVEPLDDEARHRLLRGLLLPSVSGPVGVSTAKEGTALQVGQRERDAAGAMLAVHGPWLDRDAQSFTITAAELAFVESLTPLVAGTPRQVKRYVNICKLLLAMSPPLEGGGDTATERTAACFMAAVHQSMPALATAIASSAAAACTAPPPGPQTTLGRILADIVEPALAPDVEAVEAWLASTPPPPPPTRSFDMADAVMLTKRWQVIRRLRFAGDEPTDSRESAPPAGPEPV